MQIKKSHARIPSWAQTLNPLLCSGSSVCLFFLKGAFHASDWRADSSSLPPSSSSQHCSPPPPSLPPSQCVAMETATWVCCSCLSFRCKRCTTHLTISWWMEGCWLRRTMRCLVARRTTFSLCRYSTACAGFTVMKSLPHFAWQRVALLYSVCLAMHKNTTQPAPG